eukprot:6220011-Heterocapsa_arctica.AAC.1
MHQPKSATTLRPDTPSISANCVPARISVSTLFASLQRKGGAWRARTAVAAGMCRRAAGNGDDHAQVASPEKTWFRNSP